MHSSVPGTGKWFKWFDVQVNKQFKETAAIGSVILIYIYVVIYSVILFAGIIFTNGELIIHFFVWPQKHIFLQKVEPTAGHEARKANEKPLPVWKMLWHGILYYTVALLLVTWHQREMVRAARSNSLQQGKIHLT